jgi:hypothetical protein
MDFSFLYYDEKLNSLLIEPDWKCLSHGEQFLLEYGHMEPFVGDKVTIFPIAACTMKSETETGYWDFQKRIWIVFKKT